MRIMGFSKHWSKLEQPTFTTFRFKRRDADWEIGEEVLVVFKPRRKGGGEKLGVALIINKEFVRVKNITEDEAIKDGFNNFFEMWLFLKKPDGYKPMNKLTLRWTQRWLYMDKK